MKNTLLIQKIDLPAWIKNSNNSLAPNSIFALSKTTNSLFNFLRNHSLEEVNFCLEKVDIKNMNSYHIVTVLRTLYPMRKVLSNWKVIEFNVRKELENRGLEVDVLLFGLNEI